MKITMTELASPIKLQLTTDNAEQTALDLLSSRSGLSRQRIKDAMNKGAVWWTRKGKTLRLRRATQTLDKGTRLQLFYDANVLSREPEPPTLIADAGRYSVWFKPHGLLSQGSQWGDHCSILRWAELHLLPKRNCFLVHRLDGDAAGLILLAHDAQSAARLSQLFQDHKIQKHYHARIQGLMLTGSNGLTLNQPLDGKTAVTHLTLLHQDLQTTQTLLDVNIETGRKHQIRRHLADSGHPIIGDRLYGSTNKLPLQLVAYHLGFICPFARRDVEYILPVEFQLPSS
jgi:tRNA pseudouridine32 synthase/23S rRNA pseudouridine746 synthase